MKCEVLAPAGSPEALRAAVRCGADAVYLGAGGFNARCGAVNFGGDGELKAAVSYCHARGVKVYLTLNTLVGDGEIPAVKEQLKIACDAGVDAVIVQDLGLARIIPACAPSLKMHASTQMSVHSPSALPLLKALGFCRVVLARELSRTEMAEICEKAASLGIEVEVFVHGALCMCLSGQCYMSAVIGQRSGNRGMCAQPCRMQAADGTYPLSLKDMSLIDRVDALERMGVTSLKIEGRMKRPEYVAASVSAFRFAADGEPVPERLRDLLGSVFSRSGHTDGYFAGKLGSDMFGTRPEDARSESASTFGELHALYRAERQNVPVNMSLALSGGRAVMTLCDGKHTVSADAPCEAAVNLPLDESRAHGLCAKLGGTPYYLDKFEFENNGGSTLPASAVNALRRDCCDRLTVKRGSSAIAFSDTAISVPPARRSDGRRIYARFENAAQIPDNIGVADRIYLPLGSPLPDLKSVGVEIPRAMFGTEENISRLLWEAKAQGAEYALCHNLAAVELARCAGLKIHLGFGMNIFNSIAASAVDADDITLSFELTLRQAEQVGRGGIIAYGRLPLMLTRNCPLGGRRSCKNCRHLLRDRKGAEFPILCRNGYSELFNNRPVMLCESRDRIGRFDFISLCFTDEDRDQCARILAAYSAGEAPDGDFTRGLYYRGV